MNVVYFLEYGMGIATVRFFFVAGGNEYKIS